MTYKYWETCAAKERLRLDEEPVPDNVSVSGEEAGTQVSEPDYPEETIAEQGASEEKLTEPDILEETLAGPDVPEEAVPETEIVDLQEIRRDREDNSRIEREVAEFFEEEERMSSEGEVKKKSLARKIFVDGLLGIPLLIVTYVAAAAFIVLCALITAVLFAAGLALLIAAVIVITNSFRIFSVNVPTALVCIGASVAAVGVGLMLFILCLLTAKYALPFIIRLPIDFEKKLGLFKN